VVKGGKNRNVNGNHRTGSSSWGSFKKAGGTGDPYSMSFAAMDPWEGGLNKMKKPNARRPLVEERPKKTSVSDSTGQSDLVLL